MLHVTGDVVELRDWAESRGARPCRQRDTGRLGLAFPGESCEDVPVEWGEFEPAFCVSHLVFVYDEAPGSRRWFIGSEVEARAFVNYASSAAMPPPPGL
jgi:hypothetical protein